MQYKYTARFYAMLLLLLLTSSGIHAQTWQDTLAMQYDSLQPYVQTGYLYNRFYLAAFVDSGYTANPTNFNGNNTASECSYNTFYKLAEDFREAAYDSTALPSYYGLKDIDYAQRNLADVPISIFQIDYQKIYPFAADSGWITFDTINLKYLPVQDTSYYQDTVYDGNGQIVNLIDTAIYNNPDSLIALALPVNQLFAASTFANAFGIAGLGTPVSFRLPSSLFFSNSNASVQYKIDLDDGAGWRTVTKNQQLSTTYGSFGRKEIKVKFEIGGWRSGEYPVAKTYLVLFKTAPPPDDAFNVSTLVINAPCPDLNNGGFGTSEARLSIAYADPTHKKLTRPFIMIEGFDSYLRKTSTDENVYDPSIGGYGRLAWNGFMSGNFYNEDGDTVFTQLKEAPLLFDSLIGLGYDILLLDFKGNLNGIEQNANALINVIRWANQEKETDEELVIVGGSMGGLVARYALRKMELENCCHQTRLYGTFDTPHDGANIPLGVQDWVYNAWKNLMSKEAGRNYKDVLICKSASQMLSYHREAAREAEYHDFQTVLDSMGHPQDCYRMAISNGTATGIGLNINPGDQLLHYEVYRDAPYWIAAAVPGFILSGSNPLMLLQNNAYAVANSPNAASNQLLLETKPLGHTTFNFALLKGINWAAKGTLQGLGTGKYLADLISPPATPFNLLAYTGVQLGVSAAFTASMQYIHNQNNNVLAQNLYLTRPTAPYDYCPGSTTNTTGEISGDKKLEFFNGLISIDLGTVVAPHANHTFVPTISSLDLPDTTDLYWIFIGEQVVANKYSPFNAVFVPTHDPFRHEEHVEITKANRDFAVNQIEANRPVLHDANTTLHKALPTTFNWGSPARVILHNVTVQNGGKMYVNRNMPLDYGSGPYPGLLSRFEMHTSYCGAYIIIQNGGLFELGENNYQTVGQGLDNNKAEVFFRKNSVIEIHAGAVLRINDNSTLVLEPGATLIIHPGAIIELAGPNAVLELQGKVRLEPGAILEPTGTGIVRFAQKMANSTQTPNFWEVHADNSIKIQGSNGQLRAQIQENLYLPADLDSVVFGGVTATIHPNKELFIPAQQVRLANSFFRGSDTTLLHHGVKLTGQPAMVKNTQFSHGVVGLKNDLFSQGMMFTVSECTFTHNTLGMQTYGGSVEAYQCTTRYNTNGWSLSDISSDASISQSIFAHNTNIGLEVYAQNNVTTYIDQCAINNNEQGLFFTHGNLRPTCNLISDNSTVGIYAENANLLLLNDNAQNKITANPHGILFLATTGIFLEEGYNNFSGNTVSYISGELDMINANPHIDVLNNNMPGTTQGNTNVIPLHVYWLDANADTIDVPVINWMPGVTTPNECAPLPGNANGNTLAGNVMMGYQSAKVVNSTNYSNVWLHEALADAAKKVSTPEYVFNDLLAIARFSEILNATSGSFTETENLAINYAAELMVSALSNAIEQGLMPLNEGQQGNPEHPYLQLVTEQLNNRIAATGLSAEQLFEMSLSLAQSYRMAQHYDYALHVLDSVSSPTTAEEIVYTQYWDCVCLAEDDLLNERILPEDFATAQENCRAILTQYFKWQRQPKTGNSEVTDRKDVVLFKQLYPNPAANGVMVKLTNSNHATTVELIDVLGKVLQNISLNATENEVLIDLRSTTAGVYLIKVTQNNQEHVQRLVVSK